MNSFHNEILEKTEGTTKMQRMERDADFQAMKSRDERIRAWAGKMGTSGLILSKIQNILAENQ